MENSIRDSREWREIKGHVKFFTIQILSIILKSCFLAALLAVLVAFDKVFHLANISGLAWYTFFALEILFSLTILITVAIYMYFYVRGIYEYYSAISIEHQKVDRHKKTRKNSLQKSLQDDVQNIG